MPVNFKKDIQYYKFCLYGFLKNQKFHEPFFLLFLLSKDISYLQAGVLYSIKEIVINLLEVPAGIIADAAGRRRTMLFSFGFYILSFLVFYISETFTVLIIPIILFGIGDVFRTGTHKAMIFDYLRVNNWDHCKVEYYGRTRSWSQAGSALSSLIAAAIVIMSDNYSAIFIFAIIPYVLNFINLVSYPAWLDGEQGKFEFRQFRLAFVNVLRSLSRSFRKLTILKLYVNSTMVSGFFNSSKDYLQPLILAFAIGLPVLTGIGDKDRGTVLIGLIYFTIYLFTSAASRSSGMFTKKIGSNARGLNITMYTIFLAGIGTGILYHYSLELISIILFLLIYAIENIRRPIAVAKIASDTESGSLTTYLSVDSQMKSLFTMILSPVIGLIADLASPGTGIAVAGGILLIASLFVKVND